MEEELLGKAYDGRLMRRLLRYMAPYKHLVAGAVACLIVYSVLQVCAPLLTKMAIDRYLSPSPSPDASSRGWFQRYLSGSAYVGLAQVSMLYLAVLVGTFLTDFGETILMQRTGQFSMFDLRRDLMGHLQRLDLQFYDRNPVGRLVTRVTTDVDALNDMFTSGIVTIGGDVLTLLFIVLAMLRLSAPLTALMLGVMPLVVAATWLFRRVVSLNYRKIRIAVARINAYLQEHIVGIAVLQLFNRERRSEIEFDEINCQHMDAYKNTITAYGWFYPVVEFLSFLALAGVLTYGGFRSRAGGPTLGVVVAFLQYGMRFFRPIQDLSEKYNILQSAMAAAERVFRLLDTRVEIETPLAPEPFPHATGPIEFEGVWFAYNDEDWVLRDVSFRIDPGETVAIVGHTGAGKTTIISLVLRFYDVQRGVVRVGGIDVKKLDPVELRRRFGVVLQDPHLFAGSIAENIRLGTEDIGDEQLEAAADQVNLLGFIRSLPDGFDQPVRERGASLSTGQKQLIGFARALAHRPHYLILDEATSSVDTETEMRVRAALSRMVEGRTAIVIAHRLSTIQRADRIFVMHRGQLRENGTHQQLLALRGLYWRLYQLQYKDQEIGTVSKEFISQRL